MDARTLRLLETYGVLIASTDRNYGNISPQPTAATLPEWSQALDLARAFWSAAAADERISPDFRRIASENLGQLESLLPLHIAVYRLWNVCEPLSARAPPSPAAPPA